MNEQELHPVCIEVTAAVLSGDVEAVNEIANRLAASEHDYDGARYPALGQAALDISLPLYDAEGQLVTDPPTRWWCLGSGDIERLQEVDALYEGKILTSGGCIIGGKERRSRAWAAFLLALYHHIERNPAEAAIWSERCLGLDPGSADSWGVWYYLWHSYLGLAAEAEGGVASGRVSNEEFIHVWASLEWAIEEALKRDAYCQDFCEVEQRLNKWQASSGVCLQDHRWAALCKRGFLHEDGFAGKYLFEASLPSARSEIQQLNTHSNIAKDLLIFRYKREYILQIEEATEDEVTQARRHCEMAWEIAQSLAEAGRIKQSAVREIKTNLDMVRGLARDRQQLAGMTHAERQEYLDKQEQAHLCRESGDLDRALMLLDWCLGRATRNPLSWWNKGQIFMTHQKYDLDKAISCFRSALALDRDDSDYWAALARALIQTGQANDLEEAKRCCYEGLKRNRTCEQLKSLMASTT